MKTDLITFVLLESVLLIAFFVSIIKDFYIRQKEKQAKKQSGLFASVKVERGEKSMNTLYVNFGIASVIFSLIVQNCEPLKGNQVLFIAINYSILIYLFFLSVWFRNAVLFKIFYKFQTD